jgi:hypothetical protein
MLTGWLTQACWSVLGPQPTGEPRTTAGRSGHPTSVRTAGSSSYRPLTSNGGEGCSGVRVSPPPPPGAGRRPAPLRSPGQASAIGWRGDAVSPRRRYHGTGAGVLRFRLVRLGPGGPARRPRDLADRGQPAGLGGCGGRRLRGVPQSGLDRGPPRPCRRETLRRHRGGRVRAGRPRCSHPRRWRPGRLHSRLGLCRCRRPPAAAGAHCSATVASSPWACSSPSWRRWRSSPAWRTRSPPAP